MVLPVMFSKQNAHTHSGSRGFLFADRYKDSGPGNTAGLVPRNSHDVTGVLESHVLDRLVKNITELCVGVSGIRIVVDAVCCQDNGIGVLEEFTLVSFVGYFRRGSAYPVLAAAHSSKQRPVTVRDARYLTR